MGLILYIIFGGIVGWVASMIAGRNAQQGLIGNIVVGIIGAFIGSWIMQQFGSNGVTGFNLSSFFVALLGAVLLLFIFNLFQRRSRSGV